jgi:mannose-6-phosphate isomerase
MMNEFDQRPWGNYTVLDEGENFKVKRIEVLPEKRLSYQSHKRRAEHWFVVGDKHRVENPDAKELLIFIETQTGDYFGEDDIERYEDDFGRK